MNFFTKKKHIVAFFILATLIPASCFAWSGKVLSVSDGDTLKVLHKGKLEKIRLYGIDAPQKKQSFGKKAGEFASSFVIGENVEVERKGTGRYGRIEALVSVNGENINQLMIINGYAWVNRQHCTEKFCNDWIKMEDAARQEKKGMWSEQNIASPKESLRPRGK